jgi:uncharacterized protein
MISRQKLREIARERNLPLDIVEKDYVLGWIIVGLPFSSLKELLIFKGGTALSKIYFPFEWRISEDLDFTLQENSTTTEISKILVEELPQRVFEKSGGLTLRFKENPYVTENFLRVRVQYLGPITKNNVKIEVTQEDFIGKYDRIEASQHYDYPVFSISTYTLENILAEKLRAILQRGHVRDYYDSWKLLTEKKVEVNQVKELFLEKCKAKKVQFKTLNQFFPENIVEQLEPYLESGLTRMSSTKLPPLFELIDELKISLNELLV